MHAVARARIAVSLVIGTSAGGPQPGATAQRPLALQLSAQCAI